MAFVRDLNSSYSSNFVFAGKEIVLRADGSPLSFSDMEILRDKFHCTNFICEPDYHYNAMGLLLPTNGAAFTMQWGCFHYTKVPLRLYNNEQTDETAIIISRAKAVTEWMDATRFCPKCGRSLLLHKDLSAMECSECGNIVFPRINPCVIVLVRRGEKILLARHTQRNQNIYACIAGFMEAGETAEQAVEREIKEETGIEVKNIRYFGSQSWPYPDQLMIGFTAEYSSGELKLQESEITDAQWFDKNNLPANPQPGSIAYRLIHSSL